MSLLLLMGDSGFNPRTLFANGEVGAWYDPSDFSTMFTDSAGTTPVTAVGDLVGLVIDKSKGGLGSLGANIFNSTGSVTVTSGVVQTGTSNDFTLTAAVANSSAIALDVGMNANSGKFYKVTFEIYDYVSGSVAARMQGVSKTTRSSNGIFTEIHTATAGGNFIGIATVSTATLKIRNIKVEQIPGNHAFQATSGNRPSLARVPFGGRRNLLNWTEAFDNAAWTKTSTAVTANQIADVNGEVAADLVACNSTGASCRVGQAYTVVSGSTYTLSVEVKYSTAPCVFLRFEGYDTSPGGYFDIQNGVVGSVSAGLTSQITSLGNGWYRCSLSGFSTVTDVVGDINVYISDALNSLTVTSGASVYLTRTQLETGSTATNYQKVTTAGTVADVTESGQRDCYYLDFASNKSLATSAIDFSATDEMTVIAGVRKVSDAASAALCETSASANANAGAFAVYAPQTAGPTLDYRSRGSATVSVTEGSASPAPITAVFTGQSDISDDSVVVRKNGVQAGTSSGDQGSGNYGNHILYIGARAGSTLYFGGHIYQLIIRGKTTPDSVLRQAERHVATRTGVTL